MNNQNKKLLTLEDLENFYINSKESIKFNSEQSGYKIAVHIPTVFEIYDNTDKTMLFVKSRVFHIGRNRNSSNVTKDAANKAMKTMAYKPLLANFTDVNGELDFTAHDMRVDPNDENSFIYDEKQIGCITADKPWFEYDEEKDKTYVCAYVAIPREYTSAAEIIERKNGTKVSVELIVNDMSFDAKEKVLQLNDVTVQGLTALGTDPDTGKEVQEGMEGSKLCLEDFSIENNSVFAEMKENKLIEILDRLNTTLSNFNYIQASAEEKLKEGGTEVENEVILNEEVATEETDVIENTEEVVETESVEEVTEETTTEETVTTEEEFSEDTTEVTPEEVGEEFSENNDESVETENDSESNEESEEFKCKKNNEEDDEDEEEIKEENKCKKNCSTIIGDNKFDFSLSLNAQIEALSILVNETYSEMDNTFYGVEAYDDHVIMIDFWNGKAYKQSYKCKKEQYSLVGDRVSVYAQYLTQDEINALENMKSNYSIIETELSTYKAAEEYADKLTVFEDSTYEQFLDTEDFKALMSEESINANTKEQLHDKAELAFAKLVRAQGSFAMKEPEVKPEKKLNMFAFAKIENTSSFLDGLLNK